MEENYRKGIVLIRGEKAGMIEETDEGYRFTYDPAYCEKEGAVAASLTLPLRTQPYFSEVLSCNSKKTPSSVHKLNS